LPLWQSMAEFVYMTRFALWHPASKAGHLLWAKMLCAAGGRYSRAFLVQRSKKSRISVSPMIFSGTANRRRSRGCREFESKTRRSKTQQSGGLLLTPVQALVATSIFLSLGKEKCKRVSPLGPNEIDHFDTRSI